MQKSMRIEFNLDVYNRLKAIRIIYIYCISSFFFWRSHYVYFADWSHYICWLPEQQKISRITITKHMPHASSRQSRQATATQAHALAVRAASLLPKGTSTTLMIRNSVRESMPSIEIQLRKRGVSLSPSMRQSSWSATSCALSGLIMSCKKSNIYLKKMRCKVVDRKPSRLIKSCSSIVVIKVDCFNIIIRINKL